MSDFSLKGLKTSIAPIGGTSAAVYQACKSPFLNGRPYYKRLCTFKWDQKKRVYKVVNETPEFWELKLNEPEFNAYINQLYKCLMEYHLHLDALRHEKKVLEELFNTSTKRAKEARK